MFFFFFKYRKIFLKDLTCILQDIFKFIRNIFVRTNADFLIYYIFVRTSKVFFLKNNFQGSTLIFFRTLLQGLAEQANLDLKKSGTDTATYCFKDQREYFCQDHQINKTWSSKMFFRRPIKRANVNFSRIYSFKDLPSRRSLIIKGRTWISKEKKAMNFKKIVSRNGVDFFIFFKKTLEESSAYRGPLKGLFLIKGPYKAFFKLKGLL